MRDDDGHKWLTTERLIELLITLPAESRVMPNAVGNLLVLDTNCVSVAYVDLAGDGHVEFMDR